MVPTLFTLSEHSRNTFQANNFSVRHFSWNQMFIKRKVTLISCTSEVSHDSIYLIFNFIFGGSRQIIKNKKKYFERLIHLYKDKS